MLPSEADELLTRRWQIINVRNRFLFTIYPPLDHCRLTARANVQAWRPIKTVTKDPLAVADATSIGEEDLVPARLIYDDHERESWTVKASPNHRWYFKYQQKPDEVLLIKCCDSRLDVARRAPHSAFQDPRHVDDPWRQSIEIRTMVFYDQ